MSSNSKDEPDQPSLSSMLQLILAKMDSFGNDINKIHVTLNSMNDRINEMSVVASLANEMKVKRDKQESMQWRFYSILHVVAAAGFIGEVQRCFSLNVTAWGDTRLWSLVINRQYVDESDYDLPKTRLMKQCEAGRDSSVRRLLQLGSDPNIGISHRYIYHYGDPSYCYCNALMIACANGRIELVKMLLAAGANVHQAVAGLGEGNHCWYRSRGFFDDGDTALFFASRHNHANIMKLLISEGAYVNQLNSVDANALHCAVEYGAENKEAVVRLLVNAGANVNQISKNDCRPSILISACTGHLSIAVVKDLILAGADVHCVNTGGDNCLMRACMDDDCDDDEYQNVTVRVEIVQELITAGVNVNHVNNNGRSALLVAAAEWTRAANGRIAEVLIAAGADVNQVNSDGSNALMLLCQRDRHFNCDFARLLIDSGINVNYANTNGKTVLILLFVGLYLSSDVESLVRMLLDAGADVNHVANDGSTALSGARRFKCYNVVALLEAQIAAQTSVPATSSSTKRKRKSVSK